MYIVNSTKKLRQSIFFQYLKTIIRLPKEFTPVIDEQVKFQGISFLFHFGLKSKRK